MFHLIRGRSYFSLTKVCGIDKLLYRSIRERREIGGIFGGIFKNHIEELLEFQYVKPLV